MKTVLRVVTRTVDTKFRGGAVLLNAGVRDEANRHFRNFL